MSRYPRQRSYTTVDDFSATDDLISGDDATIGDDLLLASDGALIKWGAAADVTLTHSADTLTLASGDTLAITTADKLTVGGVIVPTAIRMSFLLHPMATITEWDLWIADRAVQVTRIDVVPSTLQGGALTATIVKAVSTATPVKTTTPLHTADAINLNTGAYTVQNITLTATTADLQFAVGNRLSIDLSGALTVGQACVTVTMKAI